MGVDVAGESQLVGYPTQFPCVSMVDWTNGKPNPRLRVLQLLHDNFGPGDKLVEVAAEPSSPYLSSMAVVTRDGKHRILLVNKRDRPLNVSITGVSGGQMDLVNQNSGFGPPQSAKLTSDQVSLGGFAVVSITLP